MRSSISTSVALSPSHLPPWVSCFPVCRYGCMNWLQAQWIGCAALLRAAQVPQRVGPLIDKALVFLLPAPRRLYPEASCNIETIPQVWAESCFK